MGDNYNEARLIDRIMELEELIKEKESEIQEYENLLGLIEEVIDNYSVFHSIDADEAMKEIEDALVLPL